MLLMKFLLIFFWHFINMFFNGNKNYLLNIIFNIDKLLICFGDFYNNCSDILLFI